MPVALLTTLVMLAVPGTGCSGAGTRADRAMPEDAGADAVPGDPTGSQDREDGPADAPADRIQPDSATDLAGDGPDGPSPDLAGLTVGYPCTDDTVMQDCGVGGSCLTFRPGFAVCSRPSCDLAPMDSCPTGATCNDFGGSNHFCLRNCTPGATGGDCPADNFVCEFTEAANCLPACETRDDCTQQFGTPKPLCLTELGGLCRTDGSPTAAIGNACIGDDRCPRYGTCVHTDPYNGGYCTIFGCDVDPLFACPDGSVCAGLPGTLSQQKACVKLCSADADCRSGYLCLPLDGAAAGADGGTVRGCRPDL
jgi:hypothetical protein